MKFPISRESLQTFTREKENEEMNKEMIEKQIILDLDKFRKDFKAYIMRDNPSRSDYGVEKVEKKFVFCLTGGTGCSNLIERRMITRDEYFNILCERVKELFIDCDFIIDPLKTYMIIDWS
jgi:hypothetical protein